jgi:hypothetical protein
MKKLLCLFVLVIMPALMFADDFSHPFANRVEFGGGFTVATNQILDSPDITHSKLSPLGIPNWGAFIINVVAGAGIGSYVQGDILGGTIGLVGELGGIGLIYGGYFSIFDFSTGKLKEDVQTGMGLMIGGAVLFAGTRIFECIRPWFYGRNENKDYAFNFTPSIDINGNPAAVASLSIKLR